MAIVIKPKRSETAASAPGTSDIVDGEIAVNIADKKIFIRHSDDSIAVSYTHLTLPTILLV